MLLRFRIFSPLAWGYLKDESHTMKFFTFLFITIYWGDI